MKSFQQWVKQNGIPLVYARSYSRTGGTQYYSIKNEVFPNAGSLSFLTIALVNSKGVLLANFSARNAQHNNILVDSWSPQKFVEVIHSYIN